MNRREQRVQRVLQITLVLNLIVMGMKLTASLYCGSLSLFVDTLHSMTDSLNNVLCLSTSRLAAEKPDREHPYGHHKFEALGALGIAGFLGVTCLEILRGIIDRLVYGGHPIQISKPVLWLMLVVLGINILVVIYERFVGQKTHSQILIADAAHTMSDVWVTVVVILGLVGVWFGHQWLDVVLSIPVAIMVFKSGWDVLKSNLPWLCR